MSHNGSNDRIIRTTFELLDRCSFEEITVKQICSETGIGRATFYRLFDSKTAVIDAHLDSMMNVLKDSAMQNDDGTWGSYERYMGSIFTTLHGYRCELIKLYENKLMERMKEALKRNFGYYQTESSDERFRMAYHIGGIMGFIETWLQDGMKEDPEVLKHISIKILGEVCRPNLMQ